MQDLIGVLVQSQKTKSIEVARNLKLISVSDKISKNNGPKLQTLCLSFNQDLKYDKRENTVLLIKLRNWLEQYIVNKKITNIQKINLINLGKTFKMFDLIDGNECRAITPFENGGSYEKYLNDTCSSNRDCVVDIMNDIEKFRLKIKKTVEKKYSSLIDNDIDNSFEVYKRLPDFVKQHVVVFSDDYHALHLKIFIKK